MDQMIGYWEIAAEMWPILRRSGNKPWRCRQQSRVGGQPPPLPAHDEAG